VTISAAQPVSVNSRAARQAMDKYEVAMQRAHARWEKEVLVANEQCARDLELALSAAKRNGNEADVAAISSLLTQVHTDAVDVDTAKNPDDVTFGRYRKFVITAEGDWQPTIPVRMGDRIRIEARGHWVGDVSRPQLTTCGPGGVVINNRNRYELIGQIGKDAGESFQVGSGVELLADRDGMLVLALQGEHRIAKGSLEVAVALDPPLSNVNRR